MFWRVLGEREHLSIAGGHTDLCCLFGNQRGSFLRMTKLALPPDPAIACLSIYPKNSTYYYTDPCSSMLTAVLFIVNRNWKQPRCSSTDDDG